MEAFVNSGPPWHALHLPWPVKRSRPRNWLGLSVPVPSLPLVPCVPFMKRSNGVSSGTSVVSYIWMAMPKNREKLYSICVYVPVESVMVWGESHHQFLKAC